MIEDIVPNRRQQRAIDKMREVVANNQFVDLQRTPEEQKVYEERTALYITIGAQYLRAVREGVTEMMGNGSVDILSGQKVLDFIARIR